MTKLLLSILILFMTVGCIPNDTNKDLYDPNYFEKNYRIIDNEIYQLDPDSGETFKVRRHFVEDFENALTFVDLFPSDLSGWTSIELNSPTTPSTAEVIELRNCILRGECDFIDNRIDCVEVAGNQAIRFYSVANYTQQPWKAALNAELFFFVEGDDVYFSGRFFIDTAHDNLLTLFDLETSWFTGHPGLRAMVLDGAISIELKWVDKVLYRQPPQSLTPFPIGQWVQVEMQTYLSSGEDGTIEVWQDGVKIIDKVGKTLVHPAAIYNILGVGITAMMIPIPQTVLVDDVVLIAQ